MAAKCAFLSGVTTFVICVMVVTSVTCQILGAAMVYFGPVVDMRGGPRDIVGIKGAMGTICEPGPPATKRLDNAAGITQNYGVYIEFMGSGVPSTSLFMTTSTPTKDGNDTVELYEDGDGDWVEVKTMDVPVSVPADVVLPVSTPATACVPDADPQDKLHLTWTHAAAEARIQRLRKKRRQMAKRRRRNPVKSS